MMPEKFPDITWAAESAKPFSGSDWQSGGVSMMRHFHCALNLMRSEIEKGSDPVKEIEAWQHWLTLCLYSSNMENFKLAILKDKATV
jgi:hypothetical protein